MHPIALAILSYLVLGASIGGGASSSPHITAKDSVSIRSDAEDAVRGFLRTWNAAWRNTAGTEHTRPRGRGIGHAELDDGHLCNEEAAIAAHQEFREPIVRSRGYLLGTIIGGKSLLLICPGWVTHIDADADDDATDAIDNTLWPADRPAVRRGRERVIAQLSAAVRQLPGDSWIAGQQVRFLVDQGRTAEALAAAKQCRMDRWWCASLAGYGFERLHEFAAADSAFTVALGALPLDIRCVWNDVRMVMTPKAGAEYAAKTCAQRDSLANIYWWLATPLLSDAIARRQNVRRVTHFARKTLVALHAALPDDELYKWNPALGGDAYTQLLIRYGWPSAASWRGASIDSGLNQYRAQFSLPPVGPRSYAAYSLEDRVSFNATWNAMRDPLHVLSDAWMLTPPPDAQTTPMEHNGPGHVWWPEEHMRYNAQVVQLPDGQTVMFRRQTGVRMAAAITPEENTALALLPLTGDSATSYLVVSEAPDNVEPVGQQAARFDNRIAADGITRSRPFIMGVELVGQGAHRIVARTRRGITPPPPLSELRRGAIDISPPAFFAADANSQSLPSDANAMIPKLLGSTTVPHGAKVGVFWESYGLTPGDSVSFTITVSRAKNPNVFQRVAAALRFTDAPVGNIATSWREPQRTTADSTTSVDRMVPILPRSIVLDLAQLASGPYWIEVTVNSPGKAPARAHSPLTIQ